MRGGFDCVRRSLTTALVGLLFALAEAPAQADRNSTRGTAPQDKLEQGIGLYGSLEFDRALLAIQDAVNEPRPLPELARAALYLGLIYMQLGDEATARTFLTVALSYDAGIQLPAGTSPKIAAAFDEIAGRLQFARPVQRRLPPPSTSGSAGGDTQTNHFGWTKVQLPQERGGPGLWTFVSGGATAAAAAAAATFAVLAQGEKSKIESEPHGRDELAVLQSSLNTKATAANLLMAATGALALSTFFVYRAESKPAEPARERPQVAAGATGDSAWLEARFPW
jgi:hypothetical protein